MVRAARPGDVPGIYRMVRDLARYEKSEASLSATAGDLRRALFGAAPAVFAHVATAGDRPGGPHDGPGDGLAGFALWFLSYSTWTGQHGIYLEDLYVEPDARGRGHGRALLGELARICVTRGYTRLEWSVLDWNTPSIGFYKSLGARAMDEWTVFRLTGGALRALGSAAGADEKGAPA